MNFEKRTDLDQLALALAEVTEPSCLVRDDGEISWCNESFLRFFGLGNSKVASSLFLSTLVDRATNQRVVNVSNFDSFEVVLSTPELGKIAQTMLVMALVGSALEDTKWFIQLHSTSSHSKKLDTQQDNLNTVAHDLKNPLSAIFSYADTLVETPVGASLTAEQRELVIRIRATATRATELVKNYQHISQLDQHGIRNTLNEVDLNAIVFETVHSISRDDLKEPTVILKLNDGQLPLKVERMHLERIVGNLLSNALKYANPYSSITVKTEEFQSQVSLSVHNMGAHIPAEELQALFKPFSRVSTSRGKSGSGLGLAIVKKICDGVGASVNVESSPETGTTFTVNFESL